MRALDRPHRLVVAALILLLAVLAVHTVGVLLDWRATLAYPFQRDYGEGIVWQQARLIPGPRAYTPMPADRLFIVFHYPPVYYLLTRATWTLFGLDQLLAGRLVSATFTIVLVLAIMALVAQAAAPADARARRRTIAIAVAAGLVPLCLHALRQWGVLMRVDMPALALPLVATWIAARARGRFWGTLAAFLLCLAAVLTKQTALPAAGMIFLVALWQRPGTALAAAAITGAVGIAIVAWIQATTGGFLWNIVAANANQFSLEFGLIVLRFETRSAPVFLLCLPAGVHVLLRLLPNWRAGWRGIARDLVALRHADVATTCRAMLLLQFVIGGAALVSLFKFGATYNYFLLWVPAACALLGVWLADLAASARANAARLGAGVLVLLAATILVQHFRYEIDQPRLAEQQALVAQIAAARAPVVSEDMTLLMRAGKEVPFEPAILIDLIKQGRWDERILLDMLRHRQFAFLLLAQPTAPPGLRTPGMEDAYVRYYPHLKLVVPGLWMRAPD